MRSFPSAWLVLMLLLLAFVMAFAPGCTCEGGRQREKRPVLACQANTRTAPPLQNNAKTLVPGAIPASLHTESGAATITLPLQTLPGRAGMEPAIFLHYNSENNADHGLGIGFSLSAGSSITRRNKTMALDGVVEVPQFNELDAFAIDGKPLVVVSQSVEQIEYRTFPDSQIRVIQRGDDFEAFLPDGRHILYSTRSMAKTGEPLAWLAIEETDARNKIAFDWCITGDDEYDYEYALTSIRYAHENVIAFVYEEREDTQRPFVGGMQLQESLRLSEVQMFHEETLVRRYALTYETSDTTKRTLLTSVQLCAGNGECFAPTNFAYQEPATGFDNITTNIAVPLSDKASPLFADVNDDGLPEYVVGDVIPASTPKHPITEWRIAKNLGGTFAPEKVGLLQEWSFVNNAEGSSEPKLIQPELATVVPFTNEASTSLLLHDVTGTNANHTVLVPNADLTFSALDTKMPRPFPLGSYSPGLRDQNAAVHLADISADGLSDLIECSNQATGSVATWSLHIWQPGGFATTSEKIPVLDGIPCNVQTFVVDINGDSITDVVFPGYLQQGGGPTEPSGNFSVTRRNTKGEWETFDTGLRADKTLFVDINADALPDAVQSGSDGRLYTYSNTGQGFAKTPQPSLVWDGLYPQTKYFASAQVLDVDNDQRGDLLLPMLDADHPTHPHWAILRSTSKTEGPTFEAIDAGMPFEAVLGEDVTLADPRIPRVVDVNGDGADDIAIFVGGKLHIFRNRAADADVLIGFSDGTNDRDIDDPAFVPNVEMLYGHLTDGADLYNAHDDPANGAAYPRYAAIGSQRVVKEYAVNDGVGGQRRYALHYDDGRYDRELQQWLGFGKRILTDLDTGETTVDCFDNVTKVNIGKREAYSFLGQIVKQWQWAPSGNLVEMTFAEKTLQVVPTNNAQTFFTLAIKTRTRRLQGLFSGPETIAAYVNNVEALNSAVMLRDSTVSVFDWDEYRNVLDMQVSTKGVDTTLRITRTVNNDVTNWRLGLPDTQTECSNGAGIEACRTIKRTTNTFGEVETEETASKDGLKDTQLSVRYERDKYGNVTKTSAEDGFGRRREEAIVYEDNGVYPKKRINALGHETTLVYDEALGVLTKETDANGLVTEWTPDGFGRVISEKRPDGATTTITRSREKMDGLWRTKERAITTGRNDDETILDSLGRPIQTFAFGPSPKGNAARIMQRIEYDRLTGEVRRQSIPTAETTPIDQVQWDEYEFDTLGRVIRHETPWGAVTTTKHDGLSTITTAVGAIGETPQITKTTVDTLGRPITMTDANGGITRHTYGPFSQLRTITDPGNDVMTWTRDAFGRVTKLEDPNRGTTTFVNDGFGDQVSSTDALGRTVTWAPDALGRPISRTDSHAGKTLTTSWTWDTATNGKGRLHSLTSPDAVKTYSYNAKGQLEKLMLTTNSDSFVASWTYDKNGRSKTLTYPQPLGEAPFVLTRDYDTHGFVVGVHDASSKYWELTEVDNAGLYKTEQLGNGLTTTRSYDNAKQTLKSISTMLGNSTIQNLAYDYDGLLNLKSRTDHAQLQNKTERFRYDKLNRLTCAYFSANENPAATCAQSFGYAANGNLVNKSDVGTLLYNDAKHPHAITNAQGDKFAYDDVGNQIMRPGGISIEYTPFDLPSRIIQGADVVSFAYDGDQQRIRKTTPNGETLYFEDLFEQVTVGNAKAFRYYVHSPERVIAVVTVGGDEPGTKYLSVDNLGSVESVTNESGVVVEKRSYGVFGEKRNSSWGQPGGILPATTLKGFTGHEEDEEFGLVNMRGRLYDPRVARFTTPDPIIADIYDGQSLNSFSYTWNNPLSFIDPSGFLPQDPNDDDLPRITVHAEAKRDANGNIYLDFYDPNSTNVSDKPGTFAAAIGAAASSADTATTGASGAITKSQEGFGSFLEGMFAGNLSDNDSWSATLGSVVGGLIPGIGLAADIRDLGAAVGHIADGKEGAWLEMGAAVIGFVPGGDIAKGIAKGVTKASAKAATKVGVELVDDAAKIVKGSTATAADGLTSAQKTAGKVNAPRGPPARRVNGETEATKEGRLQHRTWDPGENFEKEVRLPSGKRADAVNWQEKTVKELKPDNRRAVRRGQKQVDGYRKELEEVTRKTWKSIVETYPKKP